MYTARDLCDPCSGAFINKTVILRTFYRLKFINWIPSPLRSFRGREIINYKFINKNYKVDYLFKTTYFSPKFLTLSSISWKFHNYIFVKELIFNVTGMGVAGGGGVPGVQFHLVPGHQVIQYLYILFVLEKLKRAWSYL